jgi:hypothetical protein
MIDQARKKELQDLKDKVQESAQKKEKLQEVEQLNGSLSVSNEYLQDKMM